MTARKVLESSGVAVSLRTVQRILRDDENIQFGHLEKRPKLLRRHVKERLD